MTLEHRFDRVSDDALLEETSLLVARGNRLTAELLAHLAEVDRRKLHLREACPSLMAYCIERLHMSEGAAAKRVWAARVARRFPVILEMIASGEIHLTGVHMLARHLTEENHEALLARARHRTKREIERLIAEIAPRPDVPSRVTALPRRAAAATLAAAPSAETIDAPRSGDCSVPAPAPAAAPELAVHEEGHPRTHTPVPAAKRRAVIRPLAPLRYEIRVTVSEETHAALSQLQDLLADQGGDPAAIIERALGELLERTLAKKAALTDRPRGGNPQRTRSRHIPAAIRRAVWLRDQGRCAHKDARGRRCSATRHLEFHHLDNWARGADHEVDRIELRCRQHNQFQAELDYGAAFMNERRRGRPTRGARAAGASSTRQSPAPPGVTAETRHGARSPGPGSTRRRTWLAEMRGIMSPGACPRHHPGEEPHREHGTRIRWLVAM